MATTGKNEEDGAREICEKFGITDEEDAEAVMEILTEVWQNGYARGVKRVAESDHAEVTRLNLQNDDLKNRLLWVIEAVEEYVNAVGPNELGAEAVAKWRASMAKALNDFAIQRCCCELVKAGHGGYCPTHANKRNDACTCDEGEREAGHLSSCPVRN